jgi:hypothetical protein
LGRLQQERIALEDYAIEHLRRMSMNRKRRFRLLVVLAALWMVGTARGADPEARKQMNGEQGDVNLKALRLAIEDLTRDFPKTCPATYLARLNELEAAFAGTDRVAMARMAVELVTFRQEARSLSRSCESTRCSTCLE